MSTKLGINTIIFDDITIVYDAIFAIINNIISVLDSLLDTLKHYILINIFKNDKLR